LNLRKTELEISSDIQQGIVFLNDVVLGSADDRDGLRVHSVRSHGKMITVGATPRPRRRTGQFEGKKMDQDKKHANVETFHLMNS